MHRSRTHRFSLAAVALTVAALTACSAPADGPEALASHVVGLMDEAFASVRVWEGADVDPGAPGSASSAIMPAASEASHVVLRRVDLTVRREVVEVRLDRASTPPSAVVDTIWGMRGRAELWQVGRDPAPWRSLAGEKPIDVGGEARFYLEHDGRAWVLVDVRSTGLTQGPDAPLLGPWGADPTPLTAGARAIVWLDLAAAQAADRHVVGARGPHLAALGDLRDDGVAPDAAAGDGRYTGVVELAAAARPGTRLAFLTALNHTASTDLATDAQGRYLRPYTESILPVAVVVDRPD